MTVMDLEKTQMASSAGSAHHERLGPFKVTPLNLRRWQNFKANRRGYWSLWLFLLLFIF